MPSRRCWPPGSANSRDAPSRFSRRSRRSSRRRWRTEGCSTSFSPRRRSSSWRRRPVHSTGGTEAAYTRGNARARDWTRLSDEQLLQLRMCDLRLDLARSPLQRHVKRLYEELDERGIRFRPHVWLSDDWFSPDGVPGIAVPFYLAHPRLRRLARKMTREVEGSNAK